MQIQLSDHFTYKKLLRFVFPSIIMMIFTSIYSVVDGLFISNFVGKTPLAAINLIMPFLIVLAAIGFMFGAGGSAIVGKTLGEGKPEKANQYFSMLIYATILCGLFLTLIGLLFIRPISIALGAKGALVEDCVLYGKIVLSGHAAFMLQNVFQSFLITAEKPQLGLFITVAAGVTNMVLDFLFIAVFHWGLAGAAAATLLGQCVGGLAPLIYFSRKNSSLLRLTRAKFQKDILLKAVTNGSSELMTNISASIVSMLYNFQLLKLAGQDGIAAFGVIMYLNFIFVAIFLGYSIGSAPIISYNYGAGNYQELQNMFRKSLRLIGIAAVILTVFSELLAYSMTKLFVGYDPELFRMTCRGLRLYAVSFLVCGFNIWGSSFFTALNNGLVSAVISFLRTLVFQVITILLLPALLGLDGVWTSIIAAEVMSLVAVIAFFAKNKKRYHYM